MMKASAHWKLSLWILCLSLLASFSSAGTNVTLFAIDNNEAVWESGNKGQNWTTTNTDFNSGGSNPDLITLNSSATLFIVDSDEEVWASSDLGVTWTQITTDFNGGNGDIRSWTVDNNDTLYAIDGPEDVWTSYDSGFTWNQVADNFNGGNGNVDGLIATSNRTLVAADASQDIWQSLDGGQSWTVVNSDFNGANSDPQTMIVNSSDTLFIIDAAEDVWVSSDIGITWQQIATDLNGGGGNINTMTLDGNNTLYAVDSGEDVWASYDSGFTWNEIANDFNGGNGDSHGIVAYTVTTLDITTPTSSNLVVSPSNGSNYAVTTTYFFNITLIDETGIDDVVITFNNTNYSLAREEVINYSSVYQFNRTGLAASTYTYQWHANNTGGNSNQTLVQSYSVVKAPPSLALTLDDSATNLTIVVGDSVNITGSNTEDGIISLYENGTLLNQGSESLSNTTTYTEIGLFNITLSSLEDENYTSGFVTRFITSVDNVTPTANMPADATYTVNSTQTINWILIDNYAAGHHYVTRDGVVVNASSWINNTNLAIPINSTMEGLWNYTLYFNDSLGNNGLPDSVMVNITENFTNIAPSVNLDSPTNGSFTALNSIVLEATLLDDDLQNLTVWIYGDGILINTTTGKTNGSSISYNWSSLSEGTHNWTVIANDAYVNSSQEYRFFTVDTILPTVTIIVPSNGTNYTTNLGVPFNFSSADANLEDTWYNLDNGTNITLTENLTFNTTEGLHVLYLYANDSASNIGTVLANFNVSFLQNESSSSSGSTGGGSSGGGSSSSGVGRSGSGEFKANPGVEAPRPSLPNSPGSSSPSEGESASSADASAGEPAPKIVSNNNEVTGAAVGRSINTFTNRLRVLFVALAVLAAVLSYVLRKKHRVKKGIVGKDERPMQFAIRKEPGMAAQKASGIFKSVKRAVARVQEKRKEKSQPLNMRTTQQKVMVKEPDKLHKLEGLIGEEFLNQIRKKQDPSQRLTKDEFSHHFPLTNQELKEKGIKPEKIRNAPSPRVVKAKRSIRQDQQVAIPSELKKLFPETLGKAKLSEKKITLTHTKSSVVKPTEAENPIKETFTLKKVEEPIEEESRAKLQTNRKINKKTNKRNMLKGLEEVYDIE